MTEKTRIVKMPLSVLLAITSEIDCHMPSQMAAARLWVDLDAGFIEMLSDVANKIPDEATKDWILDELYHVEPSAEPQE